MPTERSELFQCSKKHTLRPLFMLAKPAPAWKRARKDSMMNSAKASNAPEMSSAVATAYSMCDIAVHASCKKEVGGRDSAIY